MNRHIHSCLAQNRIYIIGLPQPWFYRVNPLSLAGDGTGGEQLEAIASTGDINADGLPHLA